MATDGEFERRGRKAHLRARWWKLIVPMGILMLLVVLVPLGLAIAMPGRGFATTASILSLCVLLPPIVLLMLVYAVLVAVSYYLARLYSKTGSIMRRAYGVTHRANLGMTTLSRRVAAPVINLSARLAYIERRFGLTPPSAVPQEESETETHG